MKAVLGVFGTNQGHWVGDGFPVRTLFAYDTLGQELSPFLLLDYAGPASFPPAGPATASRPRGVGTHPHRGFETVTIVYQGEVAHRDSTGQGGVIGPGDVQWMTAGSGILHEEFHSRAFTEQGGELEMIQLWVNLPARDKMTAPGYQPLLKAEMPVVSLPGAAGSLRLIAGDYAGQHGPAQTFSPLLVWDLDLNAGAETELPLPAGWSATVMLRQGDLHLNGEAGLTPGRLALLAQAGQNVRVRSNGGAQALVIAGEPLDEPIVGRGPFVMNSHAEIAQAIADFNEGRFGQMPA